MTLTPTCAGDRRTHVCGLCGRPPGQPCATRGLIIIEPRPCPACDGTGFWPKNSTQGCLVCQGSGLWDTNQKGQR